MGKNSWRTQYIQNKCASAPPRYEEYYARREGESKQRDGYCGLRYEIEKGVVGEGGEGEN